MEMLVALKDVPHSIGRIEKGQTFGVVNPELAEDYVRAGFARREGERVKNLRGWDGLLWDGATVVCIASGPTLTQAQCDVVRQWREAPVPQKRRVIVVNTSYERAPWADAIHAGDDRWWRFHWDRVSLCKGEFFALDATLSNVGGGRIRLLKHQALPGLGSKPGVIHQGANSGYQAVCLAYWSGAAKIVLLGYDCHSRGGQHWHGEHPPELRVRNQYKFWINQFARLAPDLAAAKVPVLNCSPDSDLGCFEKARLEEALS